MLPMLIPARRGLVSIATLSRLSYPGTNVPRFFSLHTSVPKNIRIQRLATARTLVTTTRPHQQAATHAKVVEGEVEEEVNAQRPPTDEQIQKTVQHGPITRFAELLERQMVSKSVVEALTQDMGLETMTQVQSMTISESLKGFDV